MKTKATMIDPVCHMTIDPANAAGSVEHGSQTYYFCSAHCVAKFKRDPQSFLNPPQAPIAIQPVSISRTKPAAQSAQSEVDYTCPMHPEIVQKGPGSCPICGMALEPKTISLEHDEANPELVEMTRRFWVCVVLTFP